MPLPLNSARWRLSAPPFSKKVPTFCSVSSAWSSAASSRSAPSPGRGEPRGEASRPTASNVMSPRSNANRRMRRLRSSRRAGGSSTCCACAAAATARRIGSGDAGDDGPSA